MPAISIVSPVYRAEKIIPELVSRIKETVSKITDDFEIILVEDHGPDNSWAVIEEIASSDQKIVGIKLSRNFGQHYAITAGLDASKGDWVVVMDCDLQDQPEEILNLYTEAMKGYDIVLARRHNRQDKFLKKFYSKKFYQLLSFLSGTKIDNSVANFGIYSRKVTNAICKMREKIRVFPVMVNWVGFKTTSVNVAHNKRSHGKSNYDFSKLFNLGLDIVLSYSDKPLRVTVATGLVIFVLALSFTIYNVFKALLGDIEVLGYASIISSLWLLSGIIIFFMGIIGLYIGKIFQGVKDRPVYIIEKTKNLSEK